MTSFRHVLRHAESIHCLPLMVVYAPNVSLMWLTDRPIVCKLAFWRSKRRFALGRLDLSTMSYAISKRKPRSSAPLTAQFWSTSYSTSRQPKTSSQRFAVQHPLLLLWHLRVNFPIWMLAASVRTARHTWKANVMRVSWDLLDIHRKPRENTFSELCSYIHAISL